MILNFEQVEKKPITGNQTLTGEVINTMKELGYL